MKIAVVGAGIMGLSTAYQLITLYPEYDIEILAKSFTPNTTSDIAAGFWRPAETNDPEYQQKLLRWALKTQTFTLDLLKTNDNSAQIGLSNIHGYLLSRKDKTPYWKDYALNFRILNSLELSQFPEELKWGCAYTTTVTEGRRFLPYLTRMFLEKGGKVTEKEISRLNSLYNDYDIIINCTGLGAFNVVGDTKMYPIRGYVLRVKAPWIKEFVYDIDMDSDQRLRYILPNQEEVVLGGYKQDHNYNREILHEERNWILREMQNFFHSLKHAEILDEVVGFRPGRKEIRLEKENINENCRAKFIIHNYGHKGNGWTLYWGCACEVGDILKETIELKAESHLKQSMTDLEFEPQSKNNIFLDRKL